MRGLCTICSALDTRVLSPLQVIAPLTRRRVVVPKRRLAVPALNRARDRVAILGVEVVAC